MMRTIRSSVEARVFTHHLKSKTTSNGKVLIITGYDYFLQKQDFKSLLRAYQEIIMVPRSVDDEYLLNVTVMPLLEQYPDIHLVTNPHYDRKHHVIYELIIRSSKSIRITTVYDFCEQFLKKLYVPELLEEALPADQKIVPFKSGLRLAKRIVDILTALILILLSWPVWLFSAIKIAFESPGKVIYRQKRLGWREREFRVIKFRSMIPNAETDGAVFSRKNDRRVFNYGSFMRATRIDELPQLLNVLKGELTLIGPRPERKIFTDSFDEVIPHYALRHIVKPGISGYAQVMYPYGAGLRDARHKLMYDLYYIKNWNFWLEMRILMATVVIILSKKGR